MALFGKKKEEEFDIDILEKPKELPAFPEIEEPKPVAPAPVTPPVAEKPKPQKPASIELTGLETAKPHMFIKVDKYKDVINKIDNLKKTILSLEEDEQLLAKINNEEKAKVDDLRDVIKKAKELTNFFEATFVDIREK